MSGAEWIAVIGSIATPLITLAGMIIGYLKLRNAQDANKDELKAGQDETKAEVVRNTMVTEDIKNTAKEIQETSRLFGKAEGVAEEKARGVIETARVKASEEE